MLFGDLIIKNIRAQIPGPCVSPESRLLLSWSPMPHHLALCSSETASKTWVMLSAMWGMHREGTWSLGGPDELRI